MSIEQRPVHSVAAHPGYVIIISLALVAIVSIVLGLLGPQEAAATEGKCSACSPHLTIGNIQISDILSAIPGFR